MQNKQWPKLKFRIPILRSRSTPSNFLLVIEERAWPTPPSCEFMALDISEMKSHHGDQRDSTLKLSAFFEVNESRR